MSKTPQEEELPKELIQDPTCKPFLSGEGDDPLATFLCSAFTGDGKWHASVSANGPVFLQDDTATNPAASPPSSPAPKTTGASASSTLKGLASSLVTFNPIGLGEAASTCLTFRPTPVSSVSNSYIAATAVSSGSIELWNFNPELTTRKVRSLGTVTEVGNEVLALSFAPDGNSLVSAGSDKCIRLYAVGDLSPGAAQGESPLKPVVEYRAGIDKHGQDTLGPNNRIFAVKHFTSSVFLAAGWETPVLVYDTRVATAAQGSFRGPHVSGNSLDVDPTSHLVVVGSDRTQGSQVDFFDMRKLRTGTSAADSSQGSIGTSVVDPACVQSISGLGLRVLATKFSKSGKTVMIGGAEENSVQLLSQKQNGGDFRVVAKSGPLPQTIYSLSHNQSKSGDITWVGVGGRGYSVRFSEIEQ